MANNKVDDWTSRGSPFLKRVDLRVSNTTYNASKMFGTVVEYKRGEWQGVCAGDSGGPLMYQDPDSGRWILIGIRWSSNTLSV